MIAFEQLLQSSNSPPQPSTSSSPAPPSTSHSSNVIIFATETHLDDRNFFSAAYYQQQIPRRQLAVGQYRPFPLFSQFGSATQHNQTAFNEEQNFTLTFDGIEDPFLSSTTSPSPISLTSNFPRWWALSAFVLVFGTAAGNVLVCLAIYWERRLQNVTNYFLMSLAITDLMVAVLVMPMGILALVQGRTNQYAIFLYLHD